MAQLSFLHLFITFSFISGVLSDSFTLTNNCAYTVWPGVLSNAGSTILSATGFSLQKGESKTLSTPSGWAGRFWGRTICKQDSSGKFSCVTGDCGSGTIECAGGGPTRPFTLAEFKLDGADGPDFYDVSLVDGYNLPMLVAPRGGSGNCVITGCSVDLNKVCPSDLRLLGEDGRETVACQSPCDAFEDPQYCCSGDYGNSNACKPSPYSQFFKHACPRARSYAYDDGTATFTCASADYVIAFCPLISIG
ncbi:hypothetical protein AAC387_Pa11g1157 [Persea americana]